MDKNDYRFSIISIVMELHFFAMFSPGFFTGWLISLYGSFNVSMLGSIVFATSSVVFSFGENLWNYFAGMMLLGVAWNFSFSAATVMLTACYEVALIVSIIYLY